MKPRMLQSAPERMARVIVGRMLGRTPLPTRQELAEIDRLAQSLRGAKREEKCKMGMTDASGVC